MSKSSSGSSHSSRVPPGVPARCWCGERITVFTSKTEENPFRRFYRCSIGLKMKNEEHLFKWVDEAVLEEVKMIDVKYQRIGEDFKDLRMEMMEMVKKINESNRVKDIMLGKELKIAKQEARVLKAIGITAVVVSSFVWVWGKHVA